MLLKTASILTVIQRWKLRCILNANFIDVFVGPKNHFAYSLELPSVLGTVENTAELIRLNSIKISEKISENVYVWTLLSVSFAYLHR